MREGAQEQWQRGQRGRSSGRSGAGEGGRALAVAGKGGREPVRERAYCMARGVREGSGSGSGEGAGQVSGEGGR